MEELSEHSESPRRDNANGNVVDELMHGRSREPLKGQCGFQHKFSLRIAAGVRRIESPPRNYCGMITRKNFGLRALRR